jgi:hypothetical protein
VPNGSGFFMMKEIFGSPPKAVLHGRQALIDSSKTFQDKLRTLSFQSLLNSAIPPAISTKDNSFLSAPSKTKSLGGNA